LFNQLISSFACLNIPPENIGPNGKKFYKKSLLLDLYQNFFSNPKFNMATRADTVIWLADL